MSRIVLRIVLSLFAALPATARNLDGIDIPDWDKKGHKKVKKGK